MSQDKKKLLVFHSIIAPYRVDFFNRLASQFQMVMHVDRGKTDDSLFSDVERECHFTYSEFASSDGLLSTLRYVVKAIHDCGPETVLVSECGLVSLIVVLYKKLFRKRYRIISMIDDSYDMLAGDNQFSHRHAMAEKILIPQFDEIINVEPRVADYFKNKYGKGVYFPIIRDEARYRRELEASLGMARSYMDQYDLEGKKVILFVGRFVALKNVAALIQVVQSVEDDSIRLVLAGAGPEEVSYKGIVNTGKVIFAGKKTGQALYAWYNVAQILALPSVREAFGAVVNEALMSGCKCLVSERAGSSCLIREGHNGYCVNPVVVQDIREKLLVLLRQVDDACDLDTIKPSLMLITFEDEFKKVVDIIQ